MGYAGYFSTTNQLKDKATPLEVALANNPSLASLEVLEKLCYNCVVGGDAKYRCVKLSNARINDAMNEPALAAMKMIGWKEVDGCLELPTNVQISMDTVRAIQAAITTIKREQSRVPSRT